MTGILDRVSPGVTGYILPGEIIGRLAGQPIAQAFRALIGYERLGLDETWLESLEPAPAGVGTVVRVLQRPAAGRELRLSEQEA